MKTNIEKNNNARTITLFVIILVLGYFLIQPKFSKIKFSLSSLASSFTSVSNNNTDTVLNEAGDINESKSDTFWLNSGGLFYFKEDYWYTVQGDLPRYAPWRLKYKVSNPLDTDEGYHPQNILRLINKNINGDLTQSLYALIVKDNLSQSPNRNESNGIFIFSHYIDSNNLYYAGIRVDGTAVIKKKLNGVYHTLAQTQVFRGDEYDKNINPNLLPKNQWIGIKVIINKESSDAIKINLYLDTKNSNDWTLVLSAVDKGEDGISPILDDGHSGIRSDFMDIEIKDYISQ